MKKLSLLILLFLGVTIYGQDTTTVTAVSDDISENLDLEAVAAAFGESKDLEDFEKKLNDPKEKLSNLDLNEDGEVDYLRVLSNSDKNTHVITVQAVIGKDQFQDVCTIDVEKDSKGETQVQVVGDVYMYGTNYIVQPVYVSPPVIYAWFWGPVFRPWYSPFYWGYYPPFYSPWRAVAVHHYRYHARTYAHHHHSYHRANVRINNNVNINVNNRRNDLAVTRPDNSFQKRNKGVSNKQGLSDRASTNNRPATNNRAATNNKRDGKATTGNKVSPSWKPSSRERVHKSTRPSTRPSTMPGSRPSTRPTSRPSTRPTYNPSTRPSTRPSNSPSTRPSSRPSTRPTSRPSYNRSMPSRSMGSRRR